MFVMIFAELNAMNTPVRKDGLDISFEECNMEVGDTIRHHFESESGTEERERIVHGVRTSARHQQ